jgi:hypothetical protein
MKEKGQYIDVKDQDENDPEVEDDDANLQLDEENIDEYMYTY